MIVQALALTLISDLLGGLHGGLPSAHHPCMQSPMYEQEIACISPGRSRRKPLAAQKHIARISSTYSRTRLPSGMLEQGEN